MTFEEDKKKDRLKEESKPQRIRNDVYAYTTLVAFPLMAKNAATFEHRNLALGLGILYSVSNSYTGEYLILH